MTHIIHTTATRNPRLWQIMSSLITGTDKKKEAVKKEEAGTL
jgi:hypothetical protein